MCNVWGIARINSLPMVLDVISEDEEQVMMMTFGGDDLWRGSWVLFISSSSAGDVEGGFVFMSVLVVNHCELPGQILEVFYFWKYLSSGYWRKTVGFGETETDVCEQKAENIVSLTGYNWRNCG
jgi:hypothetical protein